MEQTPPSYETVHQRTWLLRTAADTDGQLHEQRVEYGPGSPFPPAHLHPHQSERFEIEQGQMLYVVDGRARRVSAGETLELAPGVTHKARNASATEPAVVRWQTRPALRTGEFFAIAARMTEEGLLEQALLAHEYRDVFRVTGALGLVTPFVAAVARLLGRRLPPASG